MPEPQADRAPLALPAAGSAVRRYGQPDQAALARAASSQGRGLRLRDALTPAPAAYALCSRRGASTAAAFLLLLPVMG